MLTDREREEVAVEFGPKLVSHMKKRFPRLREECRDLVHEAFKRAVYIPYRSKGGYAKGLKQKAKGIALNAIKKHDSRAEARNIFRDDRPPLMPDPMKRLDWKIDLERAIVKATTDGRMRAALWHHIYEGYTLEEVADMLNTSKQWVHENLKCVRKIMRQGGYRNGVTSHA